ncbi:MAG: hypothetical protein EAZ91_23635 [Cytophagales bacterium]|nr:MAG: hypothetical protein EAZ91_23635 [Cytophagales bacterium]
MIDFLKLWAGSVGLAERLQKHPDLSFLDYCDKQGNKVCAQAICDNFTFRTYASGRVEIKGSIHHYFNIESGNGSVNWNDFSRLDLYDTLYDFSARFGLDMDAVEVHNIEVGANISLPDDWAVKGTLKRLIAYKTTPFERKPVSTPGYYVEAEMDDFYLKAYDKSSHQRQPNPILRFEMKIVRMKKAPRIRYLSDLLNLGNLNALGKLLRSTFNQCLWLEPFDMNRLSDTERTLIETVREPDQYFALTTSQRYEWRKKYKKLTRKYTPGLKAELGERLNAKLDELIQSPDILRRGDDEVTTGHFTPLNCIAVSCQQTPAPSSSSSSSAQPSTAEVSSSAGSEAEAVRRCPVTGFDISHQSPNTKYLSETSIRSLFDTARPIFDELAARYLTSKKQAAPLVSQCESISHNIRDEVTNKYNNLRKQVIRSLCQQAGQPLQVFDTSEVVLLSADRRALLAHFQNTALDVLPKIGVRDGTSFGMPPKRRGGRRKKR